MTMRNLIAISFLFIITTAAHAGWQVTQPAQAFPREPFFQTAPPVKPVVLQKRPLPPPPAAVLPLPPKPYPNKVLPNQFVAVGPPSPIYVMSLCGSLKDNLERILGRYKWKVVWKAPYDYNFDGRVTGENLQNAIEKLLKPFPLQAVMYMSNRTVAIIPRLNA